MFGYTNVALREVAFFSPDRIAASELNKENYIGVDNLLQNKQGKTISETVPKQGNSIKYLPEDILLGNIRPYLRKIWFANGEGGTNGDVLDIRVNNKEKLLPKYLYYVLSSERFFNYDTSHSKGAKMPRGDKEAVMNYQFQIPDIERQKRIIENLDKFDALINDITEGIPAEIEARQKQYEYYRNKLLTFKRLES